MQVFKNAPEFPALRGTGPAFVLRVEVLDQAAELIDAPGGVRVGAADNGPMKNASPDQFRARHAGLAGLRRQILQIRLGEADGHPVGPGSVLFHTLALRAGPHIVPLTACAESLPSGSKPMPVVCMKRVQGKATCHVFRCAPKRAPPPLGQAPPDTRKAQPRGVATPRRRGLASGDAPRFPCRTRQICGPTPQSPAIGPALRAAAERVYGRQ